MPHVILRPADRNDALLLSERLRMEDIVEIYASSGMSPLEALCSGLEYSSPHAWALADPASGEPYLMGGVRPLQDGIGLVWLLASPAIERHALTVQREAKSMLLRIWEAGDFRALCNIVAADNHKAVRWLERLGFIIVHRDQPIGLGGELFHTFAINKKETVCAPR